MPKLDCMRMPSTRQSSDRARVMGMRSMRQRAEILGGNLRIDSGPGAGTRVELRVPRRTAILAPPNDEEGDSTDV